MTDTKGKNLVLLTPTQATHKHENYKFPLDGPGKGLKRVGATCSLNQVWFEFKTSGKKPNISKTMQLRDS